MKSYRLPFLFALAAAACASPPPARTPAPTPADRPATAPADQPAASPADSAPAAPADRPADSPADPAPTAPADQPADSPADPAPTAPADQPATSPTDPAAEAGAVEEAVPTSAPAHWWMADTDAVPPGAGVVRAYRELVAGREPERIVVVGVIDSGVEIGHEDLDENIWVNDDEVPGNGVDDDDNGYADDVHGWNFIGGPDGRHVDKDTYEVTRLYARCTARDGSAGDIPGVDSCAEIEDAFQEDRREAEQQLRQIRLMSTAVQRFVGLLENELGTDSLTVEQVRALTPIRMDVRQAQRAYLQLADNGITPRMVEDERQRLEDRLQYGLNPEFDPRDIVGDDYADVTERGYGNPDVTGPRAGHGTGVAGIIAGERGNGIGEDGIAPSVRIMVLRTVPDGDERDKDVANAIRYAADNGAHIINMSFGKGYSPHKDEVDAAVRYAEEKGVLLVHAAGNGAADLSTEPNFPNRSYRSGGEATTWIEVGASGWQGRERLAAAFTNYGPAEVDVFAPGVDIRTTDVDNAFQENSGTSFAAPVVSGLAALIMAYYPELDASDVRRVILEAATAYRETVVARPGGEGDTVRFGELSATGAVVNAYAALRMAERLAAER
jgi:subtilisin family serine protease